MADPKVKDGAPNGSGMEPRGDESSKEAERRRRIAEIAYYNAERRGFLQGAELDDWLAAERQIDGSGSEKGPAGEASALQAESAVGDGTARDGSGGPSTATDRADTPDLIQADAERIEPDQVKKWARQLNVSAPRLREAIKRVGPVVDDVKRFLESAPPPA